MSIDILLCVSQTWSERSGLPPKSHFTRPPSYSGRQRFYGGKICLHSVRLRKALLTYTYTRFVLIFKCSASHCFFFLIFSSLPEELTFRYFLYHALTQWRKSFLSLKQCYSRTVRNLWKLPSWISLKLITAFFGWLLTICACISHGKPSQIILVRVTFLLVWRYNHLRHSVTILRENSVCLRIWIKKAVGTRFLFTEVRLLKLAT